MLGGCVVNEMFYDIRLVVEGYGLMECCPD